VTTERPKRVLEGGRPVAFDEEMSNPGKAVRRHRPYQGIPGTAERDRHRHNGQPQQRSRGVHHAVAGMAVLAQIMLEEFLVSGKARARHDYLCPGKARPDGDSKSILSPVSSTRRASFW